MRVIDIENNNQEIVACSCCFCAQGLRIEAEKIGDDIEKPCPNCNHTQGRKLTKNRLEELAFNYFVSGSMIHCSYGAFYEIQFNQYQETSIDLNINLEKDIKVFEDVLGIGFFYYGPRAWMLGEVEPLKKLLDINKRTKIIKRIVRDYPEYILLPDGPPFYRIRKGEDLRFKEDEFDSPPDEYLGKGRFDAKGHPVLYASTDIELCMHESRVTIEDELYIATLIPTSKLRLLNLAGTLREEKHVTPFESLALATDMLFNAGKYAYDVIREISIAVKEAGFDRIVYPSYFRRIRSETNISDKTIDSINLAIFGHPIRENKLKVVSIDRLILSGAKYEYSFGPVKPDN